MRELDKKARKAKRVWKHTLEKAYSKKLDEMLKRKNYEE